MISLSRFFRIASRSFLIPSLVWVGCLSVGPFALKAADYHWKGGTGIWSTSDENWYLSGTPGAFLGWQNGNAAIFGASGDTMGVGAITVSESVTSIAGLRFTHSSVLSSEYSLEGQFKTDPITSERIAVNVTSTGDIALDDEATASLRYLGIHRSGAFLLRGENGGQLVLNERATLSSGGYLSLNGAIEVVVNAGAEIRSGDTLIVGTTVANNSDSGSAHLIVDGGTVTVGVSTGSRNLILGNRASRAGDTYITLKSGSILGSSTAGNGLAFENTTYTHATTNEVIHGNAIFNLDGGLLEMRRIVASGSTQGVSRFNFNGGTWKIINPLLDGVITNSDRIEYIVKSGGAVIDTNGFNVIKRGKMITDSTLVGALDGGLTKLGAGALTLEANNTFTGALSIREGSVIASEDLRIGDASKIVIFDGAKLENRTTSFELKSSRNIELAGTAGITVNAGNTLTYKGQISDVSGQVGKLVKSGAGTLSLAGGPAATFSGGLDILGGVVRIDSNRQLGPDAGLITLNNGTLQNDTSEVVTHNFHIGTNGGRIKGSAWNARGVFTGSGKLQIENTIVLGGKNIAFTGEIEVLANSNLGLRQASTLGTAAGGILLRDNALLRLDHNGIGGSGFDSDDRFYKDALTMQSGSHLMTLGAHATSTTQRKNAVYQGNITLGSGNLTKFTVYNQSGVNTPETVPDLEIEGAISGSGGIDKLGVGRLVLKSSNSYTGKTKISAGELELRHAAALQSVSWIQVNGGTKLNTTSLSSWQLSQQVLSGEGSLHGNIVVGQGAQLRPGTNADSLDVATAGTSLGTLEVQGELRLSNTAAPAIKFQLGANDSDHVNLTGALTIDTGVQLAVEWVEGTTEISVTEYDLINWQGLSSWGDFDAEQQLLLPTLSFIPGASWDRSQFLSHGIIRVIPEPGRAVLSALALSVLCFHRRRK